MDRLTWRDKNGVAQLGKRTRSSLSLTMREAVDKLAEYEDIGLSPDVLWDVAAREDNVQEALDRMEEHVARIEAEQISTAWDNWWIDPALELPERNETVVVECIRDTKLETAVYEHGENPWKISGRGQRETKFVKRWLRLPKLPKESESDDELP